MKNFFSIPTINMLDLEQGSTIAIQKLDDICQHVGFFYLENHGITLQAMEQVLNLTQAFFALPQEAKDAISIANSPHFRDYPPSQQHIGVGPHTDAGFLVFLLQDAIGGLEVQNATGEWIAATPKAGTFIVNLGEMLEAWSNGKYHATKHRVLNTSSQARYSAPFFYEPHLSTEVIPGTIYGERILSIYQRSYPAN